MIEESPWSELDSGHGCDQTARNGSEHRDGGKPGMGYSIWLELKCKATKGLASMELITLLDLF